MSQTGRGASCIVAGGGPAGMMIGYLLARAGVNVVVLEKHADFLRDFRGDTIHPSTMDVLAELALLEEFLALPHQEVKHAELEIAGERVRIADLTHLPTRCKFIAFIPQWDFLDFLASKAKLYPNFKLMMESEAVDLVWHNDRVEGVRMKSAACTSVMHADLVIAADGRHSTLRRAARLKVTDLGAPMDVLWFTLARRRDDDHAVLGRVEAGQALVMLDRGDYWQCALIIRKRTAEAVKAQGLDAFQARIAKLANRPSAGEIASLDDVKLLTVTVDRLETWSRTGLLCIGDAAHAMSPIGGVGINLAIQDAVAAANAIVAPMRANRLNEGDLRKVQSRRWFPTWATQTFQVMVQNRIIDPLLKTSAAPYVPWAVRLMQYAPILQRFPARLIGIGFRPEHVDLKVIDAGR